MARFFIIFSIVILGLAPVNDLYAQDLPENCDVDNLANCFIEFPIFCQNDTSGSLKIGVSEKATLTFSAQFSGKSPWDKLQLFFTKSVLSAGGDNERQITSMNCTGDEELGRTCFGEIDIPTAESISNDFDTEAQTIGTAFRVGNSGKAKRDRCIGTFTNNTEAIVQNNRLVRKYCSFSSFDPTVSGEGFFDPRSYGVRPSNLDAASEATFDSHFHFALSGLPTDGKIRGCLQEDGKNSFQEVFSFSSWEVNRTDEEIYNRFDQATAEKLAFEAQNYSYDLSRRLLSQSSRLDVSKDLSKVNLQISRPSGSSATKSSNSDRKSKRQKKREKKNQNKRTRSTLRSLAVAEARAADTRGKDSAINWLSFDPGTNRSVYIAKKCNQDTPTNAFGTLTCGNDVGDGRVCKFLTPTDSNSTATGIFCSEHRDGKLYNLLTLRVLGLSTGVDYTACLDGVEVPVTFSPIGNEGYTYASLELTDSETVANSVPSIYKSSRDITNFDQVTVGTGGCSSPLLSGALSNEE